LTFESYVDGYLGGHFKREEFLERLAEQKSIQLRRFSKAMIFNYAIILLMIFLPSIGNIRTPIADIEISKIYYAQDLLNILASVTYIGLITASIDYYILIRCLSIIMNKFNMFSGNYFFIHINPQDIWTDSLQLRFFGPSSGMMHKIQICIANLIMIPIVIIFFVTPIIFITLYSTRRIGSHDYNFIDIVLGTIPIFIAVGMVIILILVAFVPARFYEGFLVEGMPDSNSIDEEAAQRIFGMEENDSSNAKD
jgi:hypothetical protein